MRAVARENGAGIRLPRRGRRGAGEAADEVGGEVLQTGEVGPAGGESTDPLRQPHQPEQGIGEFISGEVVSHP